MCRRRKVTLSPHNAFTKDPLHYYDETMLYDKVQFGHLYINGILGLLNINMVGRKLGLRGSYL